MKKSIIMKFIEYINRLERIDQLIRLKATGSPKTFADKIGVSERYLYELLNVLKKMGAELRYDKYRETYVHKNPCKLKFGFEMIDKKEIKGGKNSSTELIFQYSNLCLLGKDQNYEGNDHLQNTFTAYKVIKENINTS